jgi:hypothetical protein
MKNQYRAIYPAEIGCSEFAFLLLSILKKLIYFSYTDFHNKKEEDTYDLQSVSGHEAVCTRHGEHAPAGA